MTDTESQARALAKQIVHAINDGDCRDDPEHEGDIAEAVPLIAAALREAEVRGLEEAARIAERFGVYPELNIANGSPEWYRHGIDIATKCRAQAAGLLEPPKER